MKIAMKNKSALFRGISNTMSENDTKRVIMQYMLRVLLSISSEKDLVMSHNTGLFILSSFSLA